MWTGLRWRLATYAQRAPMVSGRYEVVAPSLTAACHNRHENQESRIETKSVSERSAWFGGTADKASKSVGGRRWSLSTLGKRRARLLSTRVSFQRAGVGADLRGPK